MSCLARAMASSIGRGPRSFGNPLAGLHSFFSRSKTWTFSCLDFITRLSVTVTVVETAGEHAHGFLANRGEGQAMRASIHSKPSTRAVAPQTRARRFVCVQKFQSGKDVC